MTIRLLSALGLTLGVLTGCGQDLFSPPSAPGPSIRCGGTDQDVGPGKVLLTLQDADGKPVAGVRVVLWIGQQPPAPTPDPNASYQLLCSIAQTPRSYETTTDDQGVATFDAVLRGSYRLTVDAPGAWGSGYMTVSGDQTNRQTLKRTAS